MPAYVQGSTNLPLQSIYPGGVGAVVWSVERPLTNAVSLAVVMALLPDNNPGAVSFEVKFAGAPGTFEIDIQEADTDEDAAYTSIANAIISSVNGGNYGRYDLTAIRAKFLRAFMKTQTSNAVNITLAKFTR
jgi:hypothetical protein